MRVLDLGPVCIAQYLLCIAQYIAQYLLCIAQYIAQYSLDLVQDMEHCMLEEVSQGADRGKPRLDLRPQVLPSPRGGMCSILVMQSLFLSLPLC